jgi:parvulin-like peptidyl-prolyl isomerase
MRRAAAFAWLAALALPAAGAWAQPQPAAPSPVIATIGSETITVADFEAEMKRRSVAGVSFASLEQKRALLDEMLRLAALVNQAREAGYERHTDIQTMVRRLLASRYEQDQLKPRLDALKVSDEEVRREYDSHVRDYSVPEYVHAAMIFIELPKGASPDAVKQATARAETALAEAAKLPATTRGFGDLARRHSDDQASKYVGGDLGWQPRGQSGDRWGQPVTDAIAKLDKPGDVGPIVRTDRGLYLVKLIEKREGSVRPFEQVRDGIAHKLMQDKRAVAERAFREEVWAAGQPKINQDLLSKSQPPKVPPDPKDRPPALPGR